MTKIQPAFIFLSNRLIGVGHRTPFSNALYGVFLIFFLSALPQRSLAQVSFEAFADSRQVPVNNYFQISFTLRNADGEDFRPPAFKNFTVVGPPGRSASTTIINGKMSKELSYNYTLQPQKKGRFTIGSASIKVNGRRFETKPVTIEVVDGIKANPDKKGEEVFLRSWPTDTTVWVGQQVGLAYKLYSAIPIDRYNVVEEAKYEDFFAQDLRRFDNRQEREIISGVQYATRVIKQLALFPQRSGDLEVGQFNIQLIAEEVDPRSRNNFFPLSRTRLIPAAVPPLTIHARPLPPDPPSGFTGAVGRFEVSSSITNDRITTDDALSVRLVIRGNGDPKRIQPPEIVFPEGFEVYPPKIQEETSFEQDNQLLTQKTFEYLAVPNTPGQYAIQFGFSWFDPDSAKYATYQSDAFAVSVTQGANAKKNRKQNEDAGDLVKDIRYLKTGFHPRNPGVFTGSAMFWLLFTLPPGALLFLFFFKQWRTRQSLIDPAQKDYNKAQKLALLTLKTANAHRQAGNGKAYYEALESALNGYLERKFDLKGARLQREFIQERLTEKGIPPALADELFSLRQRVEIALYGGAIRQEDLENDHKKAAEWIARCEGELDAGY